jgi:hypothetical protein
MNARFRLASVSILIAALTVGSVVPASAGGFSPTTHFRLSSLHVGTPAGMFRTEREPGGQDGIKGMYYTAPPGYRLATFRRLQNGEQLGSGTVTTSDQPFCNDVVQETVPFTISFEMPDIGQIQHGVNAIWRVDFAGGTSLEIFQRGSSKMGWLQYGEESSDDGTCPPARATIKIFRRSSVTKTPIITNPRRPGSYQFTTTFTSWSGDEATVRQTVRIPEVTG